MKATGTGGAPLWRPDFEQRSWCQTKICYTWCCKRSFLLFIASTSLDTKTLTTPLNRNFENCLSIRCFPIFAAGFSFAFSNFAHYCVVLLNTPLSDRDIKKKGRNGFLFPGNFDPSSLMPGGLVLPLVWGFGRRDNFLMWRELLANLYRLKSRIWFWEEYNHFECIYRVFRFDRFSSNFSKNSKDNYKWKCVLQRNSRSFHALPAPYTCTTRRGEVTFRTRVSYLAIVDEGSWSNCFSINLLVVPVTQN